MLRLPFLFRLVSTLIAGAFVALLAAEAAQAQGTALGNLAAQMQPGTWAVLNTSNLEDALTSANVGGGASGGELTYAENGAWDPINRKALFAGSDHNTNACTRKFIQYDDASNIWSWSQPSWMCAGYYVVHGYDHQAVDSRTGTFYTRDQFQDGLFRKYIVSTQAWAPLPDNTMIGTYACCGGLAFLPNYGSQGSLVFAHGSNGGELYRFDVAGQTWSRIGMGLSGMGEYHNFAEYNPVNKVAIFGGGQGSRAVYKLEENGTISRLADAPVSLGTGEGSGVAITVADPVSGDYLVFTAAGVFYSYNVVSGAWTNKGTTAPIFTPKISGHDNNAVWEVIAVPISTYGVTMFVKYYPGACKVYLYKHAQSVMVPPPAPTALQVH